MTNTDEQIARRAKESFDRSVDGLDAATLSKLNRGRQAALRQAASPGAVWLRWMPVTGAAAAVLLAVIMLRGPAEIADIQAPTSDFEILMSTESIEMLEDLEFYSWLATQELDGDLG